MSTTRLLILGVVRWLQPVHGYDVRRELLSWNVEQWANVAPGSVYHALRKLAEEGLLAEVSTAQVGNRPARTTYQVTPKGEREFGELLRKYWWDYKTPIDPFGVPVEEIQQGIRHGVRKVNVDTDGRLAITAAVREAIAANPEEFDPRHFTRASREGMKHVVAERMRQFGQAGHARDYEPLTLDEIRLRYEARDAMVTAPTAATP